MRDRLMTCAQVDERLADWLENDLDADTRIAVEHHIATCVRCTGLVGDLDTIRRDAAALPELVPSHDLWQAIEARIQAPVITLAPAAAPRERSRRVHRAWWLGAAAAGLVAITAGITHLATRYGFESSTPVVASADPAVVRGPDSTELEPSPAQPVAVLASDNESPEPQPVERSTRETAVPAVRAGSQYDRDVAQLRAILEKRRMELDSSTVTVLERNLELIDRAIAESRAALERDPASEFLADQLARVMTKKVAILRTAALLPSRS
ncbi:MAG: anti-sigma factor family protein [Gemmatimonadaceae bacterium]